ncbi:hypothetical protein FHU38_001798 [Saccharomonospora amisosensis]|uniref:Uncharacterized protein n=1 Tax=Saccharomonospora amisosensis TaxID=1128677 RepID=A0A7X5ZQ61_9PSEU|nr:hypothetical protein [Saccharomonospora amisosensis]
MRSASSTHRLALAVVLVQDLDAEGTGGSKGKAADAGH